MLYLNSSRLLLTAAICALSLNVFAVSDTEITQTVDHDIHRNKVTADSHIKVETKNGVVFLTGNVQTEGEASTAIETANSVVGVRDVDSERLTVKNGSQPYKDSFITAKIKGAYIREKLFGDQPIDVTGISVETKDGVVYLTGTAVTQAQADSAIDLAKKIKGVRDVESKIVIKQQ